MCFFTPKLFSVRAKRLLRGILYESLTCLAFEFFPVELVAFVLPSIPLRTLMKSFLETVDISLARFLMEPPASLTFSSTFFWCFCTALNNCTTPLQMNRPEQCSQRTVTLGTMYFFFLLLSKEGSIQQALKWKRVEWMVRYFWKMNHYQFLNREQIYVD